jgi:hypothetical protein
MKINGQFTNINNFLLECASNGNLEGVKVAIANGADLSEKIKAVFMGGIFGHICTVFELATHLAAINRYNLICEYLDNIYKQYEVKL